MLTRIRIEVEGEDSAAATEEALTKYEHALQQIEATRWSICGDARFHGAAPWPEPVVERDFYNSELGREVTDEVIEYDPSLPGYKGRRVVRFQRLDTRSHFTEPCGGETKVRTKVESKNATEPPAWLEHTKVGPGGVEVES